MKKIFFYKMMVSGFAVLLALSGTTPYIVHAQADIVANARDDDSGNIVDEFEDSNSDNSSDDSQTDSSDSAGDNIGDDDIGNAGDNTGDDDDSNAGDNTGDDDADNDGNDNTDDTGNNKKGIIIQIGKKQKEVEVLKGSFVKKKGVKYFKNQNGKLIKNQFFCKGKNVYYVNSEGQVSLGWNKIKGHYYFFDRKSGKMKYNMKVDRIKITKKGIAKETELNIEIIKVYLKAQKIVQEVSKPTDSKADKLYKCYLWMAELPYKQFRTMKEAKETNPNDWHVVFANDIFKSHQGCCASEACAFAYLAVVCEYEKVTICSDTGHAWVDIDGKLYDPLFAEAKSFESNYNASYTDYRIHPAYTRVL